jgi:hypothetical protein
VPPTFFFFFTIDNRYNGQRGGEGECDVAATATAVHGVRNTFNVLDGGSFKG